MSALPRVAIAIGDPAGIGPEIALKAALDRRVRAICRPVLVGDPQAVRAHARSSGIDAPIDAFDDWLAPAPRDGAVALLARGHFARAPLEIGAVRAVHGEAAVDAARVAIEGAMRGHVEAVVAAPQTEAAIHAAGIAFDGYPSFVARCTGTPVDDAFLMICFDATRIAHATLHVSVRRALELLTRARIERVIRVTHATLLRLGIARPRIAVSGVNPHASEGGLFGSEEAEVVAPAIAACSAGGIDASGPFGADTMFHHKDIDAYVVMFHDQGHIAAKLQARNRTAGLTIGTPIAFSSVAHGSALDIAGTNHASPAAMIEAIERLVGRAASSR
jgi:4-hydroxy-L-threonine phosphate dehydrogenase PdxA